MKIKKFCATATLLAAACAMQAGALAAEAPAATGTATQSTVGTAVTATDQTANTDAAAQRCADKLGRLAAEEDLRCGQNHLAG
mgnify:CR=1 FL=1